DGRLAQDFEHPQTRRYTINSLLGLQAAARATPHDERLADVRQLVDDFLTRHEQRIVHPGDLGLLTLLLCETGDERAGAMLARAASAAGATHSRLDVQSLSWALWGATAGVERGLDGAAGAAVVLLRR